MDSGFCFQDTDDNSVQGIIWKGGIKLRKVIYLYSLIIDSSYLFIHLIKVSKDYIFVRYMSFSPDYIIFLWRMNHRKIGQGSLMRRDYTEVELAKWGKSYVIGSPLVSEIINESLIKEDALLDKTTFNYLSLVNSIKIAYNIYYI